jgi:hypothetical protein
MKACSGRPTGTTVGTSSAGTSTICTTLVPADADGIAIVPRVLEQRKVVSGSPQNFERRRPRIAIARTESIWHAGERNTDFALPVSVNTRI